MLKNKSVARVESTDQLRSLKHCKPTISTYKSKTTLVVYTFETLIIFHLHNTFQKPIQNITKIITDSSSTGS